MVKDMLVSLRFFGFLRPNAAFRPPRGLWARFREIRHAIEGRRAIAAMDARMLSDIGLSRADAEEEVRRLPWDTGRRG